MTWIEERNRPLYSLRSNVFSQPEVHNRAG
jgi:hypothetical protein